VDIDIIGSGIVTSLSIGQLLRKEKKMKQGAYLALMILTLAMCVAGRPAIAQNQVGETHGKIFLDEDFSKCQVNQAPSGWVVRAPNPALAPIFQAVDFPGSRSGNALLAAGNGRQPPDALVLNGYRALTYCP